jgi:hypothetical protein
MKLIITLAFAAAVTAAGQASAMSMPIVNPASPTPVASASDGFMTVAAKKKSKRSSKAKSTKARSGATVR